MNNPNAPIGQNKMNERTKTLAHLCSFDNADFCTNHGNRALGITTLVNAPDAAGNKMPILKHSRHANETGQKPYNRDSAISQHRLQNSLHSSLLNPHPEQALCLPNSTNTYDTNNPSVLLLPPSTTQIVTTSVAEKGMQYHYYYCGG